jgi:hypothetical protein
MLCVWIAAAACGGCATDSPSSSAASTTATTELSKVQAVELGAGHYALTTVPASWSVGERTTKDLGDGAAEYDVDLEAPAPDAATINVGSLESEGAQPQYGTDLAQPGAHEIEVVTSLNGEDTAESAIERPAPGGGTIVSVLADEFTYISFEYPSNLPATTRAALLRGLKPTGE